MSEWSSWQWVSFALVIYLAGAGLGSHASKLCAWLQRGMDTLPALVIAVIFTAPFLFVIINIWFILGGAP